jgi:peptide methionine sulfoxide reductase MsrA
MNKEEIINMEKNELIKIILDFIDKEDKHKEYRKKTNAKYYKNRVNKNKNNNNNNN